MKKLHQKLEKTEQKKRKLKYQMFIFDFSGINAGPAVRKYARELEIDLSKNYTIWT